MSSLQLLEFNLLDFIAAHCHSAFGDLIMPLISALGNGGIIWIILGLAMLPAKKSRRCGCTVLLALLLCLLVGNITLKPWIARIRPFDVNTLVTLIIAAPTDFSFPSGHTMSSFAAAASIFHCNRPWGSAALVLAGLIAFSRLYLYVHYPTDVLGGLLIGLALSIVAISLIQAIVQHQANSRKAP